MKIRLEAEGMKPFCWIGIATPEVGLAEISFPPCVVPTAAETAPVKTGVIVTLVEPRGGVVVLALMLTVAAATAVTVTLEEADLLGSCVLVAVTTSFPLLGAV